MKTNMEIMLQNFKTEMFDNVLRKMDYLMKVEVFMVLIVMDFGYKLCLFIQNKNLIHWI